MNPEAQEVLDNILKKTPEELRKDEIAFLKARRSYVKKSDLDNFSSVLSQTSEKETVNKNAKTKK